MNPQVIQLDRSVESEAGEVCARAKEGHIFQAKEYELYPLMLSVLDRNVCWINTSEPAKY